MTTSQARALEHLRPRYGLRYRPEPLDVERAFGRDAPVVLEIGFGNGETFVEQAASDPDRNYLGIEVHEPGLGHCLLLLEKLQLANVRVIAHDAVEVLEQQIGPASLARINVYFPDPWPKKRHHKRRLIQPAFLELAASRLVAGGEMYLATDWGNYAEHIDEVIAASSSFDVAETFEHAGDRSLDRPTTKFERRGIGKGHRIRDWRLVRR